jgi:hypothetical protein
LGYDALRADIARKLTGITASGQSGRGVIGLCRDELWGQAVDLIHESGHIAVISGFFVPSVSSPETDGPAGSLVLARALARFRKNVRVWTDSFCLEAFKTCAEVLGFPQNLVEDASAVDFDPGKTDLFVYVERLGRALDGNYYNMRGNDISAWTAPLDSFAALGARSIGIGDGGNEVGMGNFTPALSRSMPDYAKCLCVVKTNVCLPVDVSNWGAYALASALSSIRGEWLGQSLEEEASMSLSLSRAGVVDGITKKNETSVDGMPLEKQIEVVSFLRQAVN